MRSLNGKWKQRALAVLLCTILVGCLTACASAQTNAASSNASATASTESASSSSASAQASAESASSSSASAQASAESAASGSASSQGQTQAQSSASAESGSAASGEALAHSESGGLITAADTAQEFEQGKKVARGDIKVVDLRGTWRQMGRQYGYLMKEELEDVDVFLDLVIGQKEGDAEKAQAVVDQQVAQTPYRVSEFFEGAAETSGLTVDELQRINAVERIGGLPKCSCAMAWGDYAASDLVIGRNYDWSDSFVLLKDDIAVTVYHPADGSLATATIGYVGEIYAVNGINEKGVFLELNNGKPSANIKSPDSRITGTTMLFECLFESDALSDLDLFFNTVNCSSSYIINVADESQGQSFEWCPVGVKHGEGDLPAGLLVSTNYFVNPEWLFAVPSDEASWSGKTRRNNLISLCEERKGSIDESKMMEIIDKPIDEGGAKNNQTVYQMVVVPKTKSLWMQITGGSAWTQIDLDSFLKS